MDIENKIRKIVMEIGSASGETYLWSKKIDLETLNIIEFEVKNGGRIAAIDGSSGIVQPVSGIHIGAIRAGYVIYSGEREKARISDIDIFNIGFHNAFEIYSERYEALFGELPPEISEIDPKYLVQRIRTLEEYRYIFMALEEMEKGDIVLVDGALRGDRHTPEIAIKRLSEMAQDMGVSVVGISKDSGLTSSGFPLIPMIDGVAKKGNFGLWLTKISGRVSGGKEEIYVVKYHPLAESAFRTDIISLERTPEVLGKIARYCNDIGYIGYPYPLADIHNEVIIRNGMMEDISSIFLFEINKNGLEIPENFHRKLDRGV